MTASDRSLSATHALILLYFKNRQMLSESKKYVKKKFQQRKRNADWQIKSPIVARKSRWGLEPTNY